MRQTNRRNRRSSGFTLMELMIVLVIIGVLAAAVTPALVARAEKAKVVRAKTDITQLATQVKMFKADNSRYPETLEDLVTKPSYAKEFPKGGYLEQLNKDPWGNDYVLTVPGENSKEFDVSSLGSDGQAGGEDNDADLHYWTMNDSSEKK